MKMFNVCRFNFGVLLFLCVNYLNNGSRKASSEVSTPFAIRNKGLLHKRALETIPQALRLDVEKQGEASGGSKPQRLKEKIPGTFYKKDPTKPSITSTGDEKTAISQAGTTQRKSIKLWRRINHAVWRLWRWISWPFRTLYKRCFPRSTKAYTLEQKEDKKVAGSTHQISEVDSQGLVDDSSSKGTCLEVASPLMEDDTTSNPFQDNLTRTKEERSEPEPIPPSQNPGTSESSETLMAESKPTQLTDISEKKKKEKLQNPSEEQQEKEGIITDDQDHLNPLHMEGSAQIVPSTTKLNPLVNPITRSLELEETAEKLSKQDLLSSEEEVQSSKVIFGYQLGILQGYYDKFSRKELEDMLDAFVGVFQAISPKSEQELLEGLSRINLTIRKWTVKERISFLKKVGTTIVKIYIQNAERNRAIAEIHQSIKKMEDLKIGEQTILQHIGPEIRNLMSLAFDQRLGKLLDIKQYEFNRQTAGLNIMDYLSKATATTSRVAKD
ncbi:hypothetical protein CROQUDRAFT_132294 [Cronartium quercuum f. sp. fusiforme G11]|uniref:Uncharacterized protein n=1 Tax=Cronartium quercuum f. sp. fusiforme G11 TaxID=708437 RepID=A0A9P6NIZ0_9BASI|nr:hypothetical protein CROQUDRAFT_132294 [Cronartium quercuum f. sp. fusiforme G11]